MSKFNQFLTENILMSVCGHLVLLAVIITSATLVLDRAKLVAPDRIEIVEIDLDSVVVSGDETKLYNVDTPEEKSEKTQEKKQENVSKKEKQEIKKTEVKTTALVDELKKDVKEETVDKKTELKNENVPKKKRVIKVNREVLSLDRTLTVSVVDALRVAMTRCWVIDNTRTDIADIRAVAHLKMRKNGTVQDVWFESAARADNDSAFAYVLGTIKDAIDTCQPFRMLPVGEYEKWKDIQLTFYPNQGKVM